jgi:hypothetical protein
MPDLVTHHEFPRLEEAVVDLDDVRKWSHH